MEIKNKTLLLKTLSVVKATDNRCLREYIIDSTPDPKRRVDFFFLLLSVVLTFERRLEAIKITPSTIDEAHFQRKRQVSIFQNPKM